MDATHLAAQIEAFVVPLLPPSVTLTRSHSTLELRCSDPKPPQGSVWHTIDLGELLDATPTSDDGQLEVDIYSALDSLQDFVIEGTAERWPIADVDTSPRVTVHDDLVDIGFGTYSRDQLISTSFSRVAPPPTL